MKNALALLLLLGLVSPISAADAPAAGLTRSTDEPPPVLGTTAQWLELQRSDARAGQPNALSDEAMERVYRRYLNTFERPIPDQFPRSGNVWQR